MKKLSIYVHIPFCEQKCLYCDFCSFSNAKNLQGRYFSALRQEILSNKKADYEVQSIYIGGGTPSSVDEKFIQGLLKDIKNNYSVDKDAEITIECNPSSTTKNKLEVYKQAGVNRISFGVQSFSDQVLKGIGRLHNGKQAEIAVNFAQEVGFKNISIDLMIGVPFQTKEILLQDIKKAVSLGVQHISAYMLQLEYGTPLQKLVEKKQVKIANEDEQAALYDALVRELSSKKYFQYEVSNFAKDGHYSKHNLNYWRRGEYLGFGLSAHSFLDNVRYANADKFDEYFNGRIDSREKLGQKEILEEIIMLGLRCFEGVDLPTWKKFSGSKFPEKKIEDLVNKGILVQKDNKIFLEPKYYSVNNEIICSLFD